MSHWFLVLSIFAKNGCMELGISMFGDIHVNKNGVQEPTGDRLKQMIEEIKLMDE